MGGKVSPREIDKLVDRLGIIPARNMSQLSSEDARVSAMQVLRKPYASLADYIIDMNLYISDAINRRAQLICFPAYTGVLPATIIAQFASVLPGLRPLAATGLPDINEVNDTLSYFSDYVFDAYFHTMAALAARHGVYIMAGSTLYFEKDDLRHRAFLFNDTGDLVGFQDKLSVNKLEQELEIQPASELKVFDTPIGTISILIGEDADYFEPARIAKKLGAKILLNPNVFVHEHTTVDMALGINMRVQENFVYGVQSVLVGDSGIGFTLEGSGCVFSPNEMLMRKNGVTAQTSGRLEPDIICARLNLDKLEDGSPRTSDKNPELMKKYIDRLY